VSQGLQPGIHDGHQATLVLTSVPRHLMARLAGLRLRERYRDWGRGPFTGESQDQVPVYEVTAAPAG
jgi:hypothetical protein